MKSKELLPFNLQFFAEEATPESNPELTIPQETTPEPTPTQEPPSQQDIMLELAKMKRAFDKTASELASTKKQLKEKSSEAEIASMEKAEKEAAFLEEFESLKKENAKNKAEKSFLSIGYPSEMAARAAEAQSDGDFEKLLKINKEYSDYLIASTKAEVYKDIPNPKSGFEEGGKQAPSKEEFLKLGVTARTQFKQEFPKTYEKYMGR